MSLTPTSPDVLIVGGGLGGVSAALAALHRGCTVTLTDPTAWLGGQLTSQLVPTDEHLFIEHTGANASYRRVRDRLRAYYRRNYPLTERARLDPALNPGAAWVSPVSVEPRVAVAVIEELLQPYVSRGRLSVLRQHRPVEASMNGDVVGTVSLAHVETGRRVEIAASVVIDATELGDLLALTATEFVSGRESQDETGEPGAPATADPLDMQAATWCFAIDHRPGEDHTIDRPSQYDRFRALTRSPDDDEPLFSLHRTVAGHRRQYWQFEPNPDDDPAAVQLDHRAIERPASLWTYRRVLARQNLVDEHLASDITIINTSQNDYTDGPLFGTDDAAQHWNDAKEHSRSFLYWLQTEAPRLDGGTGWPGLRLRGDVTGTADGFAMHPYIRESRRIRARTTILEQDVSVALRGADGARRYHDSVGTGHYFWIDRHASTVTRRGAGGLPQPFQIPLGALVPIRVRNLLPANKNIGTTQITNGCYRLHPVEWSIGEAAGTVAAHTVRYGREPHQIVETPSFLADLQSDLDRAGVQRQWPADLRWGPASDVTPEPSRSV